MKFKDQVASAARKANKTVGMIKRNFEYINKDVFELLYGTLVRPQLEYTVHLTHFSITGALGLLLLKSFNVIAFFVPKITY